ncbi:MAG: hypothetical protein HFJ54_05195 [Clostridia bacterium]|nr:hypothetical protein [Clostridia bacterium]
MEKKAKIKKGILKIVATIFVAIIPISFLYSLVMLILEPTNVCVVENRKNI